MGHSIYVAPILLTMNRKYKSLSEYKTSVFDVLKNDLEIAKEDLSLELMLVYLANFILYTNLFFLMAKLIKPWVNFLQTFSDVAIVAIILLVLQALLLFVSSLGFTFTSKFQVKELLRFDFNPSVHIFFLFVGLHLLLLMLVKFLPSQLLNKTSYGAK